MAEGGANIWKKYGALEYVECIGDDLTPKSVGGPKHLTFTKLTKAKSNETVVFSYVVYKSRAHRDQVNAKMMKDPAMDDPKNFKTMPFDMKRMAYGGFAVIVDAKK
jgi:uncharacterized protein YbaA (DUF1428 family)